MNEQQILEVESDNHDRIYLYAGELFWYVYERSAFHLVKVVKMECSHHQDSEYTEAQTICFCIGDSVMREMMQSFTVQAK